MNKEEQTSFEEDKKEKTAEEIKKSAKEGLSMTYDGLKAVFEKLGVEVFGENGDSFDPNIHNAVMHIEDENLGEGEIVDVFQKGYKINDKVIRPAMVKVAN